MAGEWNEENWFDLADYADVDMDAGYDYELSIDSSDGIAASGDLPSDPGHLATDGVEEGSLSLTTVRPVEEPVPSKDKGQLDHKQVEESHLLFIYTNRREWVDVQRTHFNIFNADSSKTRYPQW